MKAKAIGGIPVKDASPKSPVSIGLAQEVLKPLLSKQGGKLAKLEERATTLDFELHNLSVTFTPKNCKVLSEVRPSKENHDGESQTFYLLDVAGHLVRLAAFKAQASTLMYAVGAVYTGKNREKALEEALTSAKRLAI